jgi:hypothetical protein
MNSMFLSARAQERFDTVCRQEQVEILPLRTFRCFVLLDSVQTQAKLIASNCPHSSVVGSLLCSIQNYLFLKTILCSFGINCHNLVLSLKTVAGGSKYLLLGRGRQAVVASCVEEQSVSFRLIVAGKRLCWLAFVSEAP